MSERTLDDCVKSNGCSPAYPFEIGENYTGLSKRELFAAMALQGLLSSDDDSPYRREDGTIIKDFAEIQALVTSNAVTYADALIAALEAK